MQLLASFLTTRAPQKPAFFTYKLGCDTTPLDTPQTAPGYLPITTLNSNNMKLCPPACK